MSNLLYQNADKTSFFNKLTEVAVVLNPGYYIRITLEAFFKNASVFRPHPQSSQLCICAVEVWALVFLGAPKWFCHATRVENHWPLETKNWAYYLTGTRSVPARWYHGYFLVYLSTFRLLNLCCLGTAEHSLFIESCPLTSSHRTDGDTLTQVLSFMSGRSPVSELAQVPVTEHYRLGSLNSIYFSQF